MFISIGLCDFDSRKTIQTDDGFVFCLFGLFEQITDEHISKLQGTFPGLAYTTQATYNQLAVNGIFSQNTYNSIAVPIVKNQHLFVLLGFEFKNTQIMIQSVVCVKILT